MKAFWMPPVRCSVMFYCELKALTSAHTAHSAYIRYGKFAVQRLAGVKGLFTDEGVAVDGGVGASVRG